MREILNQTIHNYSQQENERGSRARRLEVRKAKRPLRSHEGERNMDGLHRLATGGCIRFAVKQMKAKFSELLTIKEAAAILGVSQMTLRRWDESGKFRARRHPLNGYRLYDRARVMKLRDRILGVIRGTAA